MIDAHARKSAAERGAGKGIIGLVYILLHLHTPSIELFVMKVFYGNSFETKGHTIHRLTKALAV